MTQKIDHGDPVDVLFRYRTAAQAPSGQTTAGVRDMLDFLVTMKARDDFWRDLEVSYPADGVPAGLRQLRDALPRDGLPVGLSPAECLASMGVQSRDISLILEALDPIGAQQDEIAAAFSEGRPEDIAQRLERLAARPPQGDLLQKMSTSPAGSRALGFILKVGLVSGVALGALAACPAYKGVSPS